MWTASRTEIDAVLEEEAAEIIEALDCQDVIASGQARCEVCGAAVKPDSIGAFARGTEEVVFACRDLSCIRAVSEGGAG
jgi:hypothetical protein